MSRIVCLALVLAICGTCLAQVPRSHHVIVLPLENHSYEQVIGNPDMPYYNKLAAQYGLATQYYSTEHNSITGLMWLVAGTWITHDDSWNTSAVSGQADALVSYHAERMLTVGTSTAPTVVSGRVTDISTAKPIAGGTVTLAGSSRTTDSAGNFSFNSVPPGTYTVQAVANGYFKESTTVMAVSGAIATANLQLPTGGIVAGTVLVNGSPLASATVTLVGGSVATTVTLKTNAGGTYNSNYVPVGSYAVTASATGFSSQTASATVTTGLKTTVNFSLGSTAAMVSGQVVDITTQKPVVGATVNIGSLRTTSDGSGNYKLTAPAGTITVTAVANGYFSSSHTISTTGGANAVQNFQLATGGKIAGTVKNSSGTAVANAKVVLTGGVVGTSVTTTTDASGVYNSNWVPVGSYAVSVTSSSSSKTQSVTVSTGNTVTLNVVLA